MKKEDIMERRLLGCISALSVISQQLNPNVKNFGDISKKGAAGWLRIIVSRLESLSFKRGCKIS